ncbi:MAG: conjugal transfer protein TraX [Defluviitaleaceae bacterium]|nr:conjugal transfer protein TraX [Defluviitaleaceae bacterium]
MNAFTLKIIALTAMILDHMGVVFPQVFGLEFRVIGRLAFPLYVFLIAEGFRHTKSPGKFLARLFAFALISEPFFDWALRGASFSFGAGGVNFLAHTNIFYTLFLGGLAIVAYEKIREIKLPPPDIGSAYWTSRNTFAKLMVGAFGFDAYHHIREKLKQVAAFAPVAACAALAQYGLTTDYGAYGVLFIFAMYVVRRKGLSLAVMAGFCIWQHWWVLQDAYADGVAHIPAIVWLMFPATLTAVALVAFYNGKRGPGFKWFFYAAYPAHLAILALLLHVM